MTSRTRVLYCESLRNPLLGVSGLPALVAIAHESGARLVVDNTFTSMIMSPLRHGADVVVHRVTKFVNGTSDCVAGCVASSREFIGQLNHINAGPSMLLGPVLDRTRVASILKNLHSLHIRLRQLGRNALYLASGLDALGYTVHYPGLASHPPHALLARLMDPGYGWLGGNDDPRHRRRCRRQSPHDADAAPQGRLPGRQPRLFQDRVYYTGPSTSSEISAEQREAAGLHEGLIRFSVGLDEDIAETMTRIQHCLVEAEVSRTGSAHA